MSYLIRPMKVEDLAQVNEIERESFPTEWPPVTYKAETLSNKLAHYIVAVDTEKALEPPEQKTRPSPFGRLGARLWRHGRKQSLSQTPIQRVVGFAGVWLMAGEAHLTVIAVREASRRLGIGELLLMAAISLATRHNARLLTLEVRASNVPSIKLYEKYGFVRVGVRRGYYSEDGEDALLMSIENLTSASYQDRFEKLKQAHQQAWGTADSSIS